MGQYYKPIILKDNKKTIVCALNTWDYGNGSKLMEHSYLENTCVKAVVNYIKENGGAHLVWAGDYADAEPVKIPKEQAKALWQELVAKGETETSFANFWAEDKRVFKTDENGEYEGENLYTLAGVRYNDDNKVIGQAKPSLKSDITKTYNIRFLVNEDKKQFVDLWDCPDIDGVCIHPLPLLTCEGNGRGGGDYHGINEKYVGSWARDFITVKTSEYGVKESLRDSGYTLIQPNFIEEYTLLCGLKNIAKYIAMAVNDTHISDEFKPTVRDCIKEISNSLKGVKEPATASAK